MDGCLDDNTSERLRLSSEEDWEQVHRLRSACDAILVGAGTLRADNPSLVIKDGVLLSERRRRGLDRDLIKVAVSGSGDVDPESRFFTEGTAEKILITCSDVSERLRRAATVIRLPRIDAASIERCLSERGVSTLMVEGGSRILTMFVSEGVYDEFRLAMAPVVVGDSTAPHLLGDMPAASAYLCESWQAGQMTVMYYRNRSRRMWQDYLHLKRAVELGGMCAPSAGSYCVGAVAVTAAGDIFEGYTHRSSESSHAEEEAIDAALRAGADLRGASMYSSMEPCSKRKSRPLSCSAHLIEHGFSRVFFAMYEPSLFVTCDGAGMLRRAGMEVHVLEDLAHGVSRVNGHLKI